MKVLIRAGVSLEVVVGRTHFLAGVGGLVTASLRTAVHLFDGEAPGLF